MILLAAAARAATWVVGTDAPDFTQTLALAAAGDTIEVPDGTWAACGDTTGRSLTIMGSGTLDGTGCDQALRVASGEAVTIEGVTFTNTTGRGLVVEWSTVSLTSVTFQANGRSDWSGGGIWAYGATLETDTCAFADNTAWEGAAVYLYAYTAWTDRYSRYTTNTTGASGGAVMAYYDNAVVIEGGHFEGNTSGYYGGAVATWDYTDLSVAYTWFVSNAATGTGGGAIFYYPVDSAAGTLRVENDWFVENTAADGGALWIGWAADAAVTNSTFTSNVATATGGAVLAYVTGVTQLARNSFCDNAAATGGAASVQWTGTDTWSNNVFAHNSATNGGAAHRYASYAGAMTQNSFAGNVASEWGGAYHASWAYADFRNNVIVDNAGAGIYTADTATLAGSTLAYNGFAENEVADAAGYFYAADGLDGVVVAVESGFEDWRANGLCDDDLRLRASSRFRDAGDPALLDLDGSRSDMGAFGGPDAWEEDHDDDGFTRSVDCDDTSEARHPLADEYCDGVDDDCDGVVDDDPVNAATWYENADGDTHGNGDVWVTSCDKPDGWLAWAGDCDDADPWVHPGASDYPGDGIDADCAEGDNTQVFPDAQTTPSGGCGCATSGPGGVAGGWPPAPGAWSLLVAWMLARGRRATRR